MKATVTLSEVCRRLGCAAGELPRACHARYRSFRHGYARCTPAETRAHVLQVLKRIHDRPLARSAAENQRAFEQGWSENYELCRQQGVSWESLRPKYVKPYRVMRYSRRYVVPEDPLLPDHLLALYATINFTRYLGEPQTICEFGCGTGRFLYLLSELFPDKSLVGADWTEASAKILELMAQEGRRIKGVWFDMLRPPTGWRLPAGSAVITIGAMEQLGVRFGAFLEFLLANRPAVVVQHEPVFEFYSPDDLTDYLGMLYHQRRNYLRGYWPALQRMAAQGRIELVAGRRLYSGDPYHESSSLLVWRPR